MRFFKTWKHTAATLVSLITLLTAVLGAAFKIDSRYAHAGQVEKGINNLEKGQLRQERRYVQDKILDLEARGDRASDFEKRRLRELRNNLGEIEERLRELK